ncbi:MAG: hypothetical protein HYU36_24930 [Planctomycetes bacterium]|nr:hypothetical protein [Planctomycetota bacterium]
MSLAITLFFLAFVGLFIYDGYRQGLYCGLTRLIALFLIAVLSRPIGSRFSYLFQDVEKIPPVVRPYTAVFLVGLALFLIGSVASHFVWKRTMTLPPEPTREKVRQVEQARWGGMVMGGLVGVALGVILFVVLWNLGWLAEEVQRGQVEEQQPEQAQAEETRPADAPVDADSVREPVARTMIRLKQAIEDSPLGGVVERANPIDNQDYVLVRRMLGLLEDPVKLDEFRRHPNMQELMQNPRIHELLEDDEIRRLVETHDYRGLLYNQKIADLVHDRELVEQVQRANVRQVLEEVERRSTPSEEPAVSPDAEVP